MGLIVVDSGVWIDWLADRDTLQTRTLRRFLTEDRLIAIGDLMLMEVLQGTRDDRKFRYVAARLSLFEPLMVVDTTIAVEAAKHYRTLRALGITIRKSIDTLIATRCVHDNLPLLYADRDFDPFVTYLGLRSALVPDPGVS